MKKIVIAIILLVSLNIIGQKLAKCGIDTNPKLMQAESKFLNVSMNDAQQKSFDLFIRKRFLLLEQCSSIRNEIGIFGSNKRME